MRSFNFKSLKITLLWTITHFISMRIFFPTKFCINCSFQFVRTERVAADASSHRRVIAYAKSGLLMAVGADINVDIGPRRDKRNSTQVYCSASFGATRMEEGKVLEIKCAE